MHTIDVHHRTTSRRTPRLWLVETLVVLGVLGFGYFAVTLDSARWTNDGSAAVTTGLNPLTELTR